MAELWRGAPVAQALDEETQKQVKMLQEQGIQPTLGILRVGERADDLSYERGAMKRCEKLGIQVRRYLLPADVSQKQLIETIDEINREDSVHGCLMFRPLPDQLDEQAARRALDPGKDVDGITDGSLAGIFTGSGEGFPPCTAQACLEVLDHYGYALKGRRVVVIGRSLVVGKPVAMLLLARHATVTICHTRSVDLPGICRQAELVIAAAGKAGVVGEGYFAPGQAVLDVGINLDEQGKLCGDVRFDAADPVVQYLTPVPGGIGTVTTSVLAKQVVQAALRRLG